MLCAPCSTLALLLMRVAKKLLLLRPRPRWCSSWARLTAGRTCHASWPPSRAGSSCPRARGRTSSSRPRTPSPTYSGAWLARVARGRWALLALHAVLWLALRGCRCSSVGLAAAAQVGVEGVHGVGHPSSSYRSAHDPGWVTQPHPLPPLQAAPRVGACSGRHCRVPPWLPIRACGRNHLCDRVRALPRAAGAYGLARLGLTRLDALRCRYKYAFPFLPGTTQLSPPGAQAAPHAPASQEQHASAAEPDLSAVVVSKGQHVEPLWLHIFPPLAPSLAFIGLPWKVVPFPQFELQAKLVARCALLLLAVLACECLALPNAPTCRHCTCPAQGSVWPRALARPGGDEQRSPCAPGAATARRGASAVSARAGGSPARRSHSLASPQCVGQACDMLRPCVLTHAHVRGALQVRPHAEPRSV